MKTYDVMNWKKEGFFAETHYIRHAGDWKENLIVRCGTLFESVWFRPYQPPHYSIPQTLYELVLDGRYCHMDQDKMVTEFRPGDWIITRLESEPAGRYDRVFTPKLHRIGVLVANTPAHDLLSRRLFPDDRTVLHAENTLPFSDLLHRIAAEMAGEGDDERLSVLMLELMQKIAGLGNEARANLPDRFAGILQECQSAGWKNASELAAHFRISERTLTRLFLKHLHTTPGRYLADARLEKARSMLSVPDLEIKEIAQLCGYASANFLTRCFRRKYRITPREYRAGKEAAARLG